MVTGQSKGFIGRTDDQGRAGRVNGDRQEFGNRQAIRRTGGTVGVRVVGQARGLKQGSRQASGDSTTGGWSERRGFGNRQDQRWRNISGVAGKLCEY